MSYAYRCLPESGCCLVRYWGEMDGDDFIEADGEVFASMTGPGLKFLFDLRNVHIRGGATSSRRYADWLAEADFRGSHPHARQAMIVEDPQDTGLTMLMAAVTEPGMDIGIFCTVEGACGYLGIDENLLAEHQDLVGA